MKHTSSCIDLATAQSAQFRKDVFKFEHFHLSTLEPRERENFGTQLRQNHPILKAERKLRKKSKSGC